jgi:TRAP-type transport system periplasmic protein
VAIGALVISSKRLAALSEENRNIINETGKFAANALTKRIRQEDDAAFARIKGKMTVTDLSGDDRAKFDSLFKQTRDRLKQGTFSADLINKLEGLAR